jgi:hypothetical protein
MSEALQRRASVRPLVGCYAELAGEGSDDATWPYLNP